MCVRVCVWEVAAAQLSNSLPPSLLHPPPDFAHLNGHASPKSKSASPPPRPVPLLAKYKPEINGYNNNYNHNNNDYNAINHNHHNSNLTNGHSHSPTSLTNGDIEHQPGCKLYYKRAKSPLRENGVSHSPLIERKATQNDPFLPFTFPDLPSYKMPAQRRFSEDVNFRRPLGE
ncbi:hypothetical protein E2C01_071819 [Portunus trituberculatus]|uniref:Uncharacterized protein n=1 Tax=Portunus trituberculatus TaxID=210409 RepID=A0A5B7I7A0_PORTR|nr:hypothetical protein [Portunus trituberculatus]